MTTKATDDSDLENAVEALLDSWHLNGPARDRLRDQARGRLARGRHITARPMAAQAEPRRRAR